jgi:hypothetical protein
MRSTTESESRSSASPLKVYLERFKVIFGG